MLGDASRRVAADSASPKITQVYLECLRPLQVDWQCSNSAISFVYNMSIIAFGFSKSLESEQTVGVPDEA